MEVFRKWSLFMFFFFLNSRKSGQSDTFPWNKYKILLWGKNILHIMCNGPHFRIFCNPEIKYFQELFFLLWKLGSKCSDSRCKDLNVIVITTYRLRSSKFFELFIDYSPLQSSQVIFCDLLQLQPVSNSIETIVLRICKTTIRIRTGEIKNRCT